MSCLRPVKDCSTELAVRTCRFSAACSPRNRSMRSFTASPYATYESIDAPWCGLDRGENQSELECHQSTFTMQRKRKTAAKLPFDIPNTVLSMLLMKCWAYLSTSTLKCNINIFVLLRNVKEHKSLGVLSNILCDTDRVSMKYHQIHIWEKKILSSF